MKQKQIFENGHTKFNRKFQQAIKQHPELDNPNLHNCLPNTKKSYWAPSLEQLIDLMMDMDISGNYVSFAFKKKIGQHNSEKNSIEWSCPIYKDQLFDEYMDKRYHEEYINGEWE